MKHSPRVVIVGWAVLCMPALLAQETLSTIFGRVLDPQVSPVANASVVVTNTETNVSVILTTNDTGYYEANLLLPGSYRVIAELPGFKKTIRSGIALPIGTRLQIDLSLALGTVSESVQVVGEAPLVITAYLAPIRDERFH